MGVSPTKMKNKLTIYFQRKQNAGGEVLDVKYPAAQPDQAWVLFRNQRGTMRHLQLVTSTKQKVTYSIKSFNVHFCVFPDAEHVLRQPDRVITINEQQFLIQLKKFEDMEVRRGQINIALSPTFHLPTLYRIALHKEPTVRSQVVSKVRKLKCLRAS